VLDDSGKLVMECLLETKAATILQFLAGLRGTLFVTFEEGTWAAWLYDLLNRPRPCSCSILFPKNLADAPGLREQSLCGFCAGNGTADPVGPETGKISPP